MKKTINTLILLSITSLSLALQAAQTFTQATQQLTDDQLTETCPSISEPQTPPDFSQRNEKDENYTTFIPSYYQNTPTNTTKLRYAGTQSLTMSTVSRQQYPRNPLTIPDKILIEDEREPTPPAQLTPHNSNTIMKEWNITGKSNQKRLSKMVTLNVKHQLKNDLKKTKKEFYRFKQGAGSCIFILSGVIITLSAILANKTC